MFPDCSGSNGYRAQRDQCGVMSHSVGFLKAGVANKVATFG